MKPLIIAIIGYLFFALLTFASLIGDANYHYNNDEWLCDSSESYTFALAYAIIPICWPAGIFVLVGHEFAGDPKPLALKISCQQRS